MIANEVIFRLESCFMKLSAFIKNINPEVRAVDYVD